MFDYAKSWEGTGGPGHWPDCDMIQIGKLSKRGPVGRERYSRFNEKRAVYPHDFLEYLPFPAHVGRKPSGEQGPGIEAVYK
jgi:hypothetical protein